MVVVVVLRSSTVRSSRWRSEGRRVTSGSGTVLATTLLSTVSKNKNGPPRFL